MVVGCLTRDLPGFTDAAYAFCQFSCRPQNLQHAQVLRDEVEEVVSEHGWTKEAFRRCEKSTVFSKKLSDLKALGLTPTVTMSDFTLADGSFVPQGTILAFPVYQIHHDDARKKESKGSRHQMVALTPDMLSFGLGTHVCPDRFFAVTMLNSMLAHIIVLHDVKLEDDKSRPQSPRVG
ncbi:hypothetical protein EV401DRAFT_1918226, partial [Pisolithus croceorrhizus]